MQHLATWCNSFLLHAPHGAELPGVQRPGDAQVCAQSRGGGGQVQARTHRTFTRPRLSRSFRSVGRLFRPAAAVLRAGVVRSWGRCGQVLGRCGRDGGVGGRAQSAKARQRREPAQRNPREVVVVQDAGGRHGLGEIYYGDRPSPTSEYLRAVKPSEPTAVSRFARLCKTAGMSASTRRRCVRARTVFVAAVVQRARSENSHS